VELEITGPTSYTSGGFIERIGVGTKLDAFTIALVDTPRTSDYVSDAKITKDGENGIKIALYRINTTTASPTAWAELGATADVSGFKFRGIAVEI
jgi:hypothetical protein